MELLIILTFILGISAIGFFAVRFEKTRERNIVEWALGGHRFGPVIIWFLLGGDVYTAYTLIAVPALAYGQGVLAFFATAYGIMAYPLFFLALPRLWNISKKYGFITAGDYTEKVFSSRFLGLIVAVIGIASELPYIGVQIFGMKYMLSLTGIPVSEAIVLSLFLLIGFTVVSGLRGPALTAFIKDILVWFMIIFLVIYIPVHYFDGLGGMFSWFKLHYPKKSTLSIPQMWVFSSLAFGSAGALFLYPHAITGALSSKSADAIKKNAIFLPLYNIMLLLVTFFGIAALFVVPGLKNPNMALPMLLKKTFGPYAYSFFSGIIILGSIVPASIMAIASANLFSKNIYQNLFKPNAKDFDLRIVSKITVVIVILLALFLSLEINPKYVIYLQLLGGTLIIQLFPLIFLPLFTNRVSRIPAGLSTIGGISAVIYIIAINGFKPVYHFVWIGLYGIATEVIMLLLLTFLFPPASGIDMNDYR